MPDSLRQRIVDAVVARMALIDGTGDYVTALGTTRDENGDAAPSVEDSRLNWEENELPAISVFDGDKRAIEGTSPVNPRVVRHSLPILIRGYLPANQTNARNARQMISDIYRAIRVDDQWSLIVMESNEVKDAITRNEQSFEIEACEVEFEVQFKTNKFNSES